MLHNIHLFHSSTCVSIPVYMYEKVFIFFLVFQLEQISYAKEYEKQQIKGE